MSDTQSAEGGNAKPWTLYHKTDDGVTAVPVHERNSWMSAEALREKFDLRGGLIEMVRNGHSLERDGFCKGLYHERHPTLGSPDRQVGAAAE